MPKGKGLFESLGSLGFGGKEEPGKGRKKKKKKKKRPPTADEVPPTRAQGTVRPAADEVPPTRAQGTVRPAADEVPPTRAQGTVKPAADVGGGTEDWTWDDEAEAEALDAELGTLPEEAEEGAPEDSLAWGNLDVDMSVSRPEGFPSVEELGPVEPVVRGVRLDLEGNPGDPEHDALVERLLGPVAVAGTSLDADTAPPGSDHAPVETLWKVDIPSVDGESEEQAARRPALMTRRVHPGIHLLGDHAISFAPEELITAMEIMAPTAGSTLEAKLRSATGELDSRILPLQPLMERYKAMKALYAAIEGGHVEAFLECFNTTDDDAVEGRFATFPGDVEERQDEAVRHALREDRELREVLVSAFTEFIKDTGIAPPALVAAIWTTSNQTEEQADNYALLRTMRSELRRIQEAEGDDAPVYHEHFLVMVNRDELQMGLQLGANAQALMEEIKSVVTGGQA